jgi:RimJ/RimL family protein N-acetyltransferase
LLVEWTDSHGSLLAQLSSDPAVVRYIGDRQQWSPEKAAGISSAAAEHWRAHGFGWRAVIQKSSREPTGFVGLNYLGEGTAGLEPDEFEIGWWLIPHAWGQGFAAEGASAVCEEAFTRVVARNLVARIQPENIASSQVATQIGMSHEVETTGRFSERIAVYRLTASDWSHQKSTRS